MDAMSGDSTGGHDAGTGTPDTGAPEGDVYDWYRRGMDLLGRGDAAAAVQLLARATRVEPGSRSVREALARAQFDAGQVPAARQTFASIVAEDPADDYARYGLGLALQRLGDVGGAVEQFALTVAMRPDKAEYAAALRSARATLAARG